MPTGAVSGILAVDVDPRNGGDDSLDSLIAQYGKLPGTAEQMTGGGGRHILFCHLGIPVPKTLAPGIDLKGDGGYIILPPSVHPTGKQYEWDGIEGAKALFHLAEPPRWLLEMIGSRNGKPANAVAGSDKWMPGERNNRLTSAAGAMRRRGFTPEAIAAALMEENRRKCEPLLPHAEVQRIAQSVGSYDPADRCGEKHFHGDETAGAGFAGVNWPEALKLEAYYGIAGELVRLIEPHSEADPVALLIQFLIGFGNLIGRHAHFSAEADRHFMNLFGVLVGQTAKGRKGTSLGQIQRIFGVIDDTWSTTRNMGGLASGEGLIWAVRDKIRVNSPIREKGRVVDYEEVTSDAGEKDKRLMVVEPEFARVLQATERESNTLSAIIRQAWDNGNLRILTKNQAARATEAHISIIGHITKDELRRLLSSTAAGNGFANRFLWVCARRSKILPEGGALHTVDFAPIIRKLKTAADFARATEKMCRDDQAKVVWNRIYPELSEGKPGLLGAVTSRAEPQVMRLACLYALLDCSREIRAEHLNAALGVWQYCLDSARFIFGDSLGDPTADEILRELRTHPQGMTRTEIRELFNRNKSSSEIGRALTALQEHGLARMDREREQEGQIRPTERWFALTAVRS